MSNSTKYVVYECDTCRRMMQISLDGRRPDPVGCNITLRCKGLLVRRNERQTKEFLLTPPVSGLDDYLPRGTVLVLPTTTADENPISISTNDEETVLAIAAVRSQVNGSQLEFFVTDELDQTFVIESLALSAVMPDAATVTAVLYEVPRTSLDTRTYFYERPTVVPFVSGTDDSLSRQNLRFTVDNDVVVFVNGLELAPSAFDRTVNDKITFTPQITDLNNVIEVIISSPPTTFIPSDSPDLIRLIFSQLHPDVAAELAIRQANAWGNFTGATIDGQDRYLLYCTDLDRLLLNKHYQVIWFEATSTLTSETKKLLPTGIYLLLGREPFSFTDKELYAYVRGADLVTADNYIKYEEILENELTVKQAIITQVFNPLVPLGDLGLVYNPSHDEATETETTEFFLGTEELVRTHVIGPR